MKLRLYAPSAIDAEPADAPDAGQMDYNLRFYTGRTTTMGPVLAAVNDAGQVVSRAVVNISEHGKITLRELKEIVPSADKEAPRGQNTP